MAETYNYPEDKELIENKSKNYNFNKGDLWLIKPVNNFGGNEINILKSINEIKMKEYVITKYFTRLDLIDNKKYDIRILVLITGINPLRLYFYKNGFIRRCVKEYSLDIKSINDKNIHLTNTHVNVEKKEYIHPKNMDDKNANIWSLNTYKNYLQNKKVNYNLFINEIKNIIIKSIISIYPNLLENNFSKNNYNLLGFDFIIPDDFQPKLLEINTRPSLLIYNDLMKIIKTNFIIDTFNLIGIVPFSHEKKIKTFGSSYNFKKDLEFKINDALCEMSRPKGDYELIFPLKTNIDKYKKYFSDISIENQILWEKI